ncbi:unnamed protein product [Acanthoscelides obtectus]|uniref:Uncharacterized protein n=1 Tax=Acanthoscelides obtectus TaxID=200917 RepID=A0A9P0JT11_ACAOB|nr:unnamed protein product [Acanthoscelides obtectus]CAK1662089.1 hypothetical protein AOBTE_LOCUS22978 [Acanthoscelides obtectus]
MAENTYEYECMRAELLGIEKPDYEEYMKNRPPEAERKEVEEDETDSENMKVIDSDQEGMRRMSGGLDELNSILKRTQSKINKFKATCGPITNLIRIKMSSRSGSACSLDEDRQSDAGPSSNDPSHYSCATKTEPDSVREKTVATESTDETVPVKKSELRNALDYDINKLDGLIEKAENAQYSMAHQSKEIKKFLK